MQVKVLDQGSFDGHRNKGASPYGQAGPGEGRQTEGSQEPERQTERGFHGPEDQRGQPGAEQRGFWERGPGILKCTTS